MIFGKTSNLDEYAYLEEKFKKAFDYYKDNNLLDLGPGSHPIDGDQVFVNIAHYQTTTRDQRFWEAHKDYIDLHIILAGEERIDLNFVDNMELGAYKKEDDFLAMEGEANSSLELEPGDFLICYPNDGHMTGLMVDGPAEVKKAIFKIKL